MTLINDLIQEFQEIILSSNPNYPNFIVKVINARKTAEGLNRVRLASIERLALALRDFPEQRSGLSDLSILIRQYIRYQRLKLSIPSDLWSQIYSRAHEFHLWGVQNSDNNSVEIGVNDWNPDWLNGAADIDKLVDLRRNTQVIGDGLLYAATGLRTYINQAQKNAVLTSLCLPPGDTLLVSLPTGAGKSLCILLPAWQDSHGGSKAGGTTLVIVPTVALALDQEMRALEYFKHSLNDHYKPWSLTGTTLPQNRAIIREALRNGSLPLLFTSPESLLKSEIYNICLEAAEDGYIKRIVIDEAHIVESWGADFRAEFQYLSTFRTKLINKSRVKPTTLLLSATITKPCEDLLKDLFSTEDRFHVVRGNNLRAEIAYWFSYSDTRDIREKRVFDAVFHLPRPMIIFVNRPVEAEALVTKLRAEGFKRIAAFSGDTKTEERARILSEWNKNERDIIVGTSAFGLGVDKGDVRTVIHAAFPESIDRFYQEVGRSGRDGNSSISLMCAEEGDRKEAFNIIKTSRITADKAVSRWEAMSECAEIIPPREMIIDLNAKPKYNLDLADNERHRDWNVHVLLLMMRDGLIRITEPRYKKDHVDDLNSVTKVGSDNLVDNTYLKIEILYPNITNSRDRLTNRLESRRTKEVSEVLNGLDKLTRMVSDYYSGNAKLCISRTLSRLYPEVSIACGGCPVCRREERKPYMTPTTIFMDLKILNLDLSTIDQRQLSKLGAHNTLNLYWDGAASIDHFKSKHIFFANLVRIGFSQIILPDHFLDDYKWVEELCKSLSEYDYIIHQILPYRSIRNLDKHKLLKVPTVILYPNITREADDLWLLLEEFFPSASIIPRVNIVNRGLYIPSLSGLFVDKVNGLNDSIDNMEESLYQQFNIIDF